MARAPPSNPPRAPPNLDRTRARLRGALSKSARTQDRGHGTGTLWWTTAGHGTDRTETLPRAHGCRAACGESLETTAYKSTPGRHPPY